MRLTEDFFNRNTVTVARQLLGKVLVRKKGRKVLTGMITETEAYHGPADRASHASRGSTPRTAVMFGPPGFTYVYLIYGMYHCLNFTTMRDGFPAAVLIRAVSGEEWPASRTDGPGKLCRIFHISKELNELPPNNGQLWIEDRSIRVPANRITSGPRVGVAYAGNEWASRPWRFIYTSLVSDTVKGQFSDN